MRQDRHLPWPYSSLECSVDKMLSPWKCAVRIYRGGCPGVPEYLMPELNCLFAFIHPKRERREESMPTGHHFPISWVCWGEWIGGKWAPTLLAETNAVKWLDGDKKEEEVRRGWRRWEWRPARWQGMGTVTLWVWGVGSGSRPQKGQGTVWQKCEQSIH